MALSSHTFRTSFITVHLWWIDSKKTHHHPQFPSWDVEISPQELGPPLRQHWIANDKEEQPFHRDERRWVYASAKGENKNFGFGTTEQLYKINPIIKHSTFPVASHTIQPLSKESRPVFLCKGDVWIPQTANPFHPQLLSPSPPWAFGSLGEKAVRAMGLGAKNANAFHNTGEGGVSDHTSLKRRLDLATWTGYYGARCLLAWCARSRGGVRPRSEPLRSNSSRRQALKANSSKKSHRRNRTCQDPIGKDRFSNAHTEFSTADELIDFIESIADRTGILLNNQQSVVRFLARTRTKWRSEIKDLILSPSMVEKEAPEQPLTFADRVSPL